MRGQPKMQPSYLYPYIACALALTGVCALPSLALAGRQEARRQEAPAAPVVEKCRADLAGRLHIAPGAISVQEAARTTWPNAALGLPRPDRMYAQVVTPGWRVVLSAKGRRYLYTTSDRSFSYGGPVELWKLSAAYIVPIADEPNLNGNLMQVSLLGTNPTILMEHVREFYPQADGGIVAKRRDSRSGHTLLYLAPGGRQKVRELCGAMDFGPAVTTDDGEWIAFMRPGLGTGVRIAHGKLSGPSTKPSGEEVLDRLRPGSSGTELPGGSVPTALAFRDNTLIAVVRNGDRTTSYEVVRGDGPWKLRPLRANQPGLGSSLMLNKSETLEVLGPAPGEAACTRVARVWFTGDQNVVATIPGFTHSTVSFAPAAPYVFLTGTRSGQPAAYTADFVTGEVIPLRLDTEEAPKLCALAPVSRPEPVRESATR